MEFSEKYASNAQDFVCELRDVSDSFLEQIAKYCPTVKKKKRPSGICLFVLILD